MKIRLLISLILSLWLSGCSSWAEMFLPTDTDKSNEIATDSIDMWVVARADLNKNQLLIYATAYVERTFGSKATPCNLKSRNC